MYETESVCSTCLTRSIQLTSVTDLDYDGMSLLEKLRSCLSLNLDVEGIPTKLLQMCPSCVVSLNLSYKFKEKVLKSLNSLQLIGADTFYEEDAGESSQQEQFILTDLPDDMKIKNEISLITDEKNSLNEILSNQEQIKMTTKIDDFTCKDCSISFEKKNKLQQHIAKFHTITDLVCLVCGIRFSTSLHLKEHLICHGKEKNYNCRNCDKVFLRLSSLKRHMKSHLAPPGQKTKKTPFLCNICGKNFPFSNGATRHMRIHFGVRMHECNICQKKFSQSTHLQVHMRTHSGEKPYICEHCGECFTLKAGLHKHLKTRHKNDDENLSRMVKRQDSIVKTESDVYFSSNN